MRFRFPSSIEIVYAKVDACWIGWVPGHEGLRAAHGDTPEDALAEFEAAKLLLLE